MRSRVCNEVHAFSGVMSLTWVPPQDNHTRAVHAASGDRSCT